MFLLSFLVCVELFGQAKRPSIMVVPDDNWCSQNSFLKQTENMGDVDNTPNYEEALLKSTDLNLVISKINSLFQDRGFKPLLLKEVISGIKQEKAEQMVITSKTSGSVAKESLYDQISRRAKADLVIKVNWEVKRSGYLRSITYIMEAVDAYTKQSVASNEGAGTPSNNSDVSVLLEEAVISKFDDFAARLQAHFDDLFENGRIVSMTVRVFESSPVDLETEFEGEELTDIIESWIQKNTVNGRYNTTDATENVLKFSQVRIPMFDPENPSKAIDTRQFTNQLRKYLAGPPYNLQAKIITQGLGAATLILGEK